MVRGGRLCVQSGRGEPAEGYQRIHERELRVCIDLAGYTQEAQQHVSGDAEFEPAGVARGAVRELRVWSVEESRRGVVPPLRRGHRRTGACLPLP